MNAGDILTYGHGTILQTIDGFPDSAWETGGVCGVWSTKDVIAHLASYEQVLIEVLSAFTGGGPTPYREMWGELGLGFNDAQVALRKERSAAAVLAEYTDAHDRVRALAARIPAETFRETGTLPWYGMEYSLDDFIVYTYYGHKREHAAQIAAFRDRIPARIGGILRE
jgi:DinB family protein